MSLVCYRTCTDYPTLTDKCLALEAAQEANCDVLGEKKAMAGHLRRCQHATAKEKGIAALEAPTKADQKAAAKRKQEKASDEADQADDEAGSAGNGRKKRKLVATVEKSFSQSSRQAISIGKLKSSMEKTSREMAGRTARVR